tara:strand:+ start:606 stop:770 length:165 start_codon:yes stop_codon:yes gene_type:complete
MPISSQESFIEVFNQKWVHIMLMKTQQVALPTFLPKAIIHYAYATAFILAYDNN